MLEWLLLPLIRLGMKGQSNRPDVKQPSDRLEFARLKQLLAALPVKGELLKKMIKEDHLLACTTKMFEILVALPHQLGQTRTSRVTTWIVRTTQVHLSFRTHILAAIRLFTCQRASHLYADLSSKFGDKIYCKRRWQLSLPSSCSPIGEADISVSFAGVNQRSRRFSHRVGQPFLPDSSDAVS